MIWYNQLIQLKAFIKAKRKHIDSLKFLLFELITAKICKVCTCHKVYAYSLLACAYFIEKQLKISSNPTPLMNINPKNAAPLKNYISKDATQRDQFLLKYPQYDGRGIKIAIIDDGVDVSLDGLQKTSEGLPKIIDCFDFSGAGDVDTSVTREMDSENTLIGLSGRKLKFSIENFINIPSQWKNPFGKWHVGLKSLSKPVPLSTPENESPQNFPEMDCIVWFDGMQWLACIDTFEDLSNATVLTNFCDKHEYGILTTSSNEIKNQAYCITVHNKGNLLEIFTPYDDHGSITAQIAAAHFPENPEDDGLAPGAQIISMNVVDAAKNNYMAYEALKKALLKCIEMKVDIVNYSIVHFMGDDEIESLINEMVKKHNILIFKSGGNSGPCYSTVNNNDLCLQNLIFKIGALLTHDMRDKIYNVFNGGEEYTPPVIQDFSSRGPGRDGNRGLDFVAPGAVNVDVPRFNSAKNSFFYGTSFSSPNAAGAVACLLSALKANAILFSHSFIKFALFKTAHLPENGNKLEFGHGIIQIDAAFEYCKNNKIDEISKMIWSSKKQQNIFIIQKDGETTIQQFTLNLPQINAISEEKWILQLSPKAESYIELSDVNYNDSSFSVKIDTNKLQLGSLNYAEIQILHPLNPSFGPIFNIPVTVILPLKITDNNCIQKEVILNHENPYHIFLDPPLGKKCKINIIPMENIKTEISVKYAINHDTNRNLENNTEKLLESTSENQKSQMYSIPIQSKGIYNICIYQKLGAAPSTAKFKFEIDFVDDERCYNDPDGKNK